MTTIKYSRQRESIKNNLRSRRDHPTADMVYEDIRKIYPKVSLGTVYRNLALLADMGEILRIPTPSGADHFDGFTDLHNHFICKQCNAVLDIFQGGDARRTMTEEVAASFAGTIEECVVAFTGICPGCTQKSVDL